MNRSRFPTLRDLRDALSELIETDATLADLPVQVIVVPDVTLQEIGRSLRPGHDRPAQMIDLLVDGSPRLPVGIVSTERMEKNDRDA